MKVGTIELQASNGRHIRTATAVYRADGKVLMFTERMSKKEALRQASDVRESAWK